MSKEGIILGIAGVKRIQLGRYWSYGIEDEGSSGKNRISLEELKRALDTRDPRYVRVYLDGDFLCIVYASGEIVWKGDA